MGVSHSRKNHTITYSPMWMGRLFDGPLRYRPSAIALVLALALAAAGTAGVVWLSLPMWVPFAVGVGPGLFANLYPRWRFYKQAWEVGRVSSEETGHEPNDGR